MSTIVVIACAAAYLWVGCVAGVFVGKLAYRRARARTTTYGGAPTVDDYMWVAIAAVFLWPLALPIVFVFLRVVGEVEADHEAIAS